MTNDENDQKSPLQRYLEKHESSGGNFSSEETPVKPKTIDDDKAIEAGAPAVPPPYKREEAGREKSHETPIQKTESAKSEVSYEPGSFGVRALAYLVDLFIVSTVTSIVDFTLSTGLFFMPDFVWFGLGRLVSFGVIFCYFGWFYAEKGATPGKMLFNLEVMETGTGRRLGYMRTFFRETVGKFLSGLIFGIGYLIVLFRDDKKAMHDMIFDTRVMRKKT